MNHLSRRQFALSLCSAPFASSLTAAEFAGMPWNGPATVAKVYLAAPRVHWPKPQLDVQQDVAEVEARLMEVGRKHAAELRFTGGEILRTEEDAAAWLGRLPASTDAVLMIPVSAPINPLNAVAKGLKVPALYYSRPYAGHGWSSIAALRKSGCRIETLASSSYGDLDVYVPAFRTIHHLRNSKVLMVAQSPASRESLGARYASRFGTAMKTLTYDDLKAAFESADTARARKEAAEFTSAALRVVEPKPKEIEDAFRLYLGIVEVMKREKANAITVDCFGGLLNNKMPAYPCIGWSKLNDQGLYGVCEGDLDSTMTQLLLTSYSGMPGFVSDPVFDLSRNEVIHAHCVAATRMKGVNGPASPYIIRDHLETAEGAVLQVLMPSGETITCARLTGPEGIMVSTGEVTGNVDTDRGCRTQIRTRVTDAAKMLAQYERGLHRVIFYGDHLAGIDRLSRMLGFTVTREA